MRVTRSVFTLLAAIILPVAGAEKEERSVFRLHVVHDQFTADSIPKKLFGKREMYNLAVEPKFADEDVESARVETSGEQSRIVIKLKPGSAERLRRLSEQWRGKRVGLVLMNKLMAAPVIEGAISNGELSVPMPNAREAELVAQMLRAVAKREEKEKRD